MFGVWCWWWWLVVVVVLLLLASPSSFALPLKIYIPVAES